MTRVRPAFRPIPKRGRKRSALSSPMATSFHIARHFSRTKLHFYLTGHREESEHRDASGSIRQARKYLHSAPLSRRLGRTSTGAGRTSFLGWWMCPGNRCRLIRGRYRIRSHHDEIGDFQHHFSGRSNFRLKWKSTFSSRIPSASPMSFSRNKWASEHVPCGRTCATPIFVFNPGPARPAENSRGTAALRRRRVRTRAVQADAGDTQ